MKIRLLARRYAQAFIDNIAEKDYDPLHNDIILIRSFIEQNPDVLHILQSIITPKKLRFDLVNTLIDKQQDTGLALKQSKYWKGLLNVLIIKHRIRFLSEVVDEIERLLFLHQNKAKVMIYLAREQGSALLDKILQYVGDLTGKKLEPRTEIEANLIGGFVAFVDSVRIDGSIKHNLEKFKKIRNN